MKVRQTELPGVLVLEPARHADDRGFFSATWNEAWLDALPVDGFVQDNHSYNRAAGTLRGLHWQEAPHGQAKLLRVLEGAVFDVAVDIRPASPTFGRWVGVELSTDRWNQLFVPAGFAHGFCTLEPDTQLLYKVSSAWKPEAERGLRWDDPDLGIEWPEFDRYVLSERDRTWPSFASIAARDGSPA